MNRIALFLGLFAAFTVWHFPHRRLVEATLVPHAAQAGFALSIRDVRYAFPLGYKLEGVRLEGNAAGAALDRVRVAMRLGSYDIDAEACGGKLHANIDEEKLDLSFSGIDPARCIARDGLIIDGRFSGILILNQPGRGGGSEIGRIAKSGRIELRGREGTLSGSIGGSKTEAGAGTTSAKSAGGMSIGTWEFQEILLDARLQGNEIVFTEGSASSQGIEWQLTRGRLFSAPTGRTKINSEVRARNVDGSNRAKAVLALLPKTTAGRDGWRRYKISGDLRAPDIVGLR